MKTIIVLTLLALGLSHVASVETSGTDCWQSTQPLSAFKQSFYTDHGNQDGVEDQTFTIKLPSPAGAEVHLSGWKYIRDYHVGFNTFQSAEAMVTGLEPNKVYKYAIYQFSNWDKHAGWTNLVTVQNDEPVQTTNKLDSTKPTLAGQVRADTQGRIVFKFDPTKDGHDFRAVLSGLSIAGNCPGAGLYGKCWDGSKTLAQRDATCDGNLVCARSGRDDRSFGGCKKDGNGNYVAGPPFLHHCCSEIPFAKVTYAKGSANKCSEGYIHITNFEECKQAAKVVGASLHRTPTGHWNNIAPFCSYASAGDKAVHFNTNAMGDNKDYTPICVLKPARYVQGLKGANTCPSDYEHIETFEECKTAAKLVEDASLHRTPSGSYVSIPPFCSYQSGGDKAVHFNSDHKGLKHKNYTPICKLKEQKRFKGQTDIPVADVVDYAFLADKIWTTDNPGFLTDRNTGSTFQVDEELDTEDGRMWLLRTTNRGHQAGEECIIVVRQAELHHETQTLEMDYKWAFLAGFIKAIPEKIPGTNFYVMKQYNEMGVRFTIKHGLVIGGWMRNCSELGSPKITLTGHSLGGAVAMWLAYGIEQKAGPNWFGTQATDIRVGKLVTFDAPPIHNPSSAAVQAICPKSLQTKNVAINFLRGGANPAREDNSFKGLAWSPWSIKGNLMGMFAEEITEGFFSLIGRDCIGHIDLGREFIGQLISNVDLVNWAIASDESAVYNTLLDSAGEHDRRDEFQRFCGDKKVLADFGCGCGHGFKANGRCPPKVQYRTRGTCPVFGGLFTGSNSLTMDSTTTYDAEACAEFCTALDGCKSWKYKIQDRRCYAMANDKTGTKTAASGWKHGVRCPENGKGFNEANVRYDADKDKYLVWPLNMDTRGQDRRDVCA